MRNVGWLRKTAFGVAFGALTLAAACGQQEEAQEGEGGFADVEIVTHEVGGGVYMLEGQGGNIGLFVGEDGAFLIDDQFAPLTPKIRAAVEAVTDQPVNFLLNTHYHPDHTGGNVQWGESGSTIVAQENVRARLAQGFTGFDGTRVPPMADAGLPVVTFDRSLTFHWNGDVVSVFHVPSAHTDGDTMVYFNRADVLHTGDVLVTVSYPIIDRNGGGSFEGIMNGLGRILAVAGPNTQIIPGHGAVTTRDNVSEIMDMLIAIRDQVAEAKAAGMSLEEVQAQNLTEPYDGQYGGGFVTGEAFVATIYNEL